MKYTTILLLLLPLFVSAQALKLEGQMYSFPSENEDIECVLLTKKDFKQLQAVLATLSDRGVFVSPIEGVHECYFKDSIETIINNKTIGNNHNPVLLLLGLRKNGNERQKVERIIKELEKRGFR